METLKDIDVRTDKVWLPQTKEGILEIFSDESGTVVELKTQNLELSLFFNPKQRKKLKEVL